MRKLTKKALSLVLCVMLVVSAISCAFSVIAETGTTTVNGNTVYDEPFDLDFSDGLKTWLGIGSSSNPKFVAEDGVLKAGSGFNTAWDEIGPARFKVPNVQVGDTIKFSFDLAINTDLGDQALTDRVNSGERLLWPIFRQYNAAGTKTDEEVLDVNKNHAGTVVSKTFTVADPDEFYRIIIRSANSLKDAWRISNITVTVTHTDGTVETYPATEEEEPEAPVVEPNPPKNLDFSEGFSYWTGETTIYSNDGGVLKSNSSYAAGSGSWRWLNTEKFNIPNAVAGTTVKLTFDVAFEDGLPSMDGNANQQPTLESTYGYKILDTYLYQYNADGTEKTNKRNEVFYNEEGTVTVGTVTIADPAEEFEFRISCGNGSRNTWEVTNITVTATHPDGTVDTYPATEQPDEPEEPTAPADSEAPYYDVDGKGIKSTVVEYPFQLKPVEQVSNLDFEDGFRFWAGGKGKGTYGDTAFDIETDGDNSYARIPATGYVSNFQTALLKLEGVTAGDKIVIIYDVKGTDGNKIRIKAEQEYVKSIAAYDITTGLNTTKKGDGSLINVTPGVPNVVVGTGTASSNFAVNLTDGWTTLIASTGNPLAAPSAGAAYTGDPIRDEYFIKLTVTCGDAGVVAGDVIDAAIDNIRIAKFANGVYTDVVTDEAIYTDPAYGKVAKVGDGYFATLEEAIAAANGGTVVLLKDIALADSVVIEAGTNIVIDLNGKTISRDTDAATSTAAIVNNGTLTIEDNVGGGKITAFAANPDTAAIPYYASNTITNCGVLTIKGGTIENSTGDNARAAFPIDNNSTVRDAILNIEGGTISGRGAIRQFANSTTNRNEVNITGGTVSGSSYGIWMQNPGSSDPLAALNVSGGTVAKILLSPSANFEPAITGGTISEVAIWDASGDANRDPSGFITGGTFNTAVDSTFCAEGFAPVDNGDGTFGIEEKEVIATVGGVNYYDFYEALEAAKNTEEKEMTVLKSIVITEDGTLDLGGVTVYAASSVQNAPVFRILANVTVTNGSVDGTTGINSYAFIVGNGETAGTLTIADGNYRGVTTAVQVSNGTANISGGTFETGHDNEGTDWGTTYLLNCMDAAYNNGTAVFNITGGTFVGFNPENNAAEGADTNFLVIAYMAQDNGDGTYTVVERPVIATVGGVNYYDLQEAINAANGGTVVLSTNITLDAPVVIAKDTVVIIDLNGKKITYTSTTQGEAMISNKGTLTINDTVGGGEIYYDYVGAADPSYSKGNYTIDNAGTLTLNGGKINIATLRQHAKYPINNNSTTGDAIFVMNGGSLYNYNTSAIRQFCNSTVYQNSVTINGGLVEGYSAIWVQNPGKNTVNGTLTITDGEIRTTAKAYVDGSATVGEVSSKIYFTTEGGAWSETSAVVITGGTFNENIYLAEEAPESLTVDQEAPIYNGNVELPVVEEYDLATELYWVKGFKPAGSEDTRYGFLMTIGIDSLDYKKDGCGFYLTVGDTTKKFIIVNGTVWESLSVDLPTETKVLAPVDFGEGNQYIMHYTVYFTEAELEALGSMEVSVKGFVTTFEGEELVTKTFNCGTLA